jgi:hypothetical protein
MVAFQAPVRLLLSRTRGQSSPSIEQTHENGQQAFPEKENYSGLDLENKSHAPVEAELFP